MSSKRMGRNPFTPKAGDSKKGEIQAAIQAEAAESRAKPVSSKTPASSSKSRKKPEAEASPGLPPLTAQAAEKPKEPASWVQGLLHKALIELPAESYLLSLKMRLLARSLTKR